MDKIKLNNIWKSISNIFGLFIVILLTVLFSMLLNEKKNMDILYL